MSSHDLQVNKFCFTEEGLETLQYGIAIRPFKVGTSVFVAYLNLNDSNLMIFLSNATLLSDNEKKRYIFQITSEHYNFNTTVSFSKRSPYCTFPNITLPFEISVFIISQQGTNPYIPYVGINNMGMTCYIASAIQFLSTVTPFMSLIFKQTPEEGSLCKELQKIFCDYLSAEGPLDLRNFVSSFGDSYFEMVLNEQDSHEFILRFFDKLDKELGKDFENERNKIFGVYGVRIIQCKNVDFESKTKEFSNEIELPIKNFTNMKESLEYITSDELFTGDNQYNTETEHGKQDAVRHLRFEKLPPFLLFHLCRYEYNGEKQTCQEVRSKFDCPEKIDMRPYCVNDIEQETNYQMIAVVAHRGNIQSGHYISFAQPRLDGHWYKFNDSTVSESSFSDVKGSYGGCDNPFIKMWSFVSGGKFITYFLGYVRTDCISLFTSPATVPMSISPHLSTSFKCKIHYSDEIEGKQIYGHGKQTIWEDPNKTIDDLFERKEFNVYVSLPYTDKLFGPISRSDRALNFCVRGFEPSFIGIPKDVTSDPIFFISDSKFTGVFSKNDIIPKFKDKFEFRYEGIPIEDCSNLSSGATVFGVPLSKITMNINKKEYTVDPYLKYSDMQLLVSNNDKEKAKRLLFYSHVIQNPKDNLNNNKNSFKLSPLRPRKYPNALALHMMGDLEAKYLDPPATTNSLDLYSPLNIDLYDIGHNKLSKNNVWFPKANTIDEFIQKLPSIFEFKTDSSYNYIVSYNQEHAIATIIKPNQHFRGINIRVDIIKAPLPMSTKEMRELFKDDCKIMGIEVRTMTYEEGWPRYRTLGIYSITKSTTANSLVKSLLKTQPIRIMIRSCNDYYKGVKIEGRDSLLGLLEQLSEMREWSKDRPYLVFKMN